MEIFSGGAHTSHVLEAIDGVTLPGTGVEVGVVDGSVDVDVDLWSMAASISPACPQDNLAFEVGAALDTTVPEALKTDDDNAQNFADTGTVFALMFGSHMVLQQSPQRANVWGWTSSQTTALSLSMTATSGNYTLATTIAPYNSSRSTWHVLMPAVAGSATAYTLKIGGAVLEDVLFGVRFITAHPTCMPLKWIRSRVPRGGVGCVGLFWAERKNPLIASGSRHFVR